MKKKSHDFRIVFYEYRVLQSKYKNTFYLCIHIKYIVNLNFITMKRVKINTCNLQEEQSLNIARIHSHSYKYTTWK